MDLRTLSDANVVGITTSGLARNLPLLRKLSSKVIVCEEAGEVQEAHFLTALLPSIEHLILIGDHLQLRPQVQNYCLSSESHEGKQYCLDISTFERLVKPLISTAQPLPFSTLEIQRRMHPSIAELVRSSLYANLQDASSVHEYPEVSGLRHRLFWLDHQHNENQRSDSQTTSHANDWEVEMTAGLVSHIVRQGVYKPSEIMVLTPYLGQLARLRKRLQEEYTITLSEGDAAELNSTSINASDADGSEAGIDESADLIPDKASLACGTLLQALRLATVDNSQGEEAKVVIISLVRCNPQRKTGFLRTENRINVLLSRAKHGMYIIGNAPTYSSGPMWDKVITGLQNDGNFGAALDLCCPRHPQDTLQVQNPEDFARVAPEAGCTAMCSEQLRCGHACVSPCHSQILHDAMICKKDCMRIKKGCNHPCELACGQPCLPKCGTMVTGLELRLECGHVVQELPCWQFQAPSTITCRTLVTKSVPGCKYSIVAECCVEVSSPNFKCTAIDTTVLPCGHSCGKQCAACNKREGEDIIEINHGDCGAICGRDYELCKHSHQDRCHDGPCGSCNARCDVSCSHSRCSREYSEPCHPCAEETCTRCPHSACSMPCGAPCDQVPCSLRCYKTLECRCRCPGVCGEPCPPAIFCQTHAAEEILSQEVDVIEFQTYGETDLDTHPCIFLDCKHIFTMSTLDGVMSMADYYDMDTGERPISLRSTDKPFSKTEIKACPNCRGSLRNVGRYGRIVRRALLDESMKKFITWSNAAYVPLAEGVIEQQDILVTTTEDARWDHKTMQLTGSSDLQMTQLRRIGGLARYSKIFAIRRSISAYLGEVQAAEQPFQRVRDMVEAVRRRNAGDGVQISPFDFDQSLLKTRGWLMGLALLLQCDLIIISDALAVRDQTPLTSRGNVITINLSANRLDCIELIDGAESSKQIVQQAKGHIFWARFAALELQVTAEDEGVAILGADRPMARLRNEAHMHLDLADEICTTNPHQTRLASPEIEATRKMLCEAVFYTALSSEEMRQVIRAMSQEFTATGHWYQCVNGHPFTVGECGGPMETSRCPQCGEVVGGTNHEAAEGVSRATAFEQRF